MTDQIFVSVVFVAVFIGIMLEKIDKTAIVLSAALLLILTNHLTFEQAVEAIDHHTLGLLMGMMIVVVSLTELQLFRWIALRLAILTRGNPVLIFVAFSVATGVISAFLDNVTTVLVTVPLLISLTKAIGLDPKPYVLSAVFLSNVGGTATLIGDPPNLMIGSRANIPFIEFPKFLLVPCVLCAVSTLTFMRWRHPVDIASRDKSFPWLFLSQLSLEQFRRELDELRLPTSVVVKAGVVCAVVLVGFFTHTLTHIEASVVALTGATALLVVFFQSLNLHHVLAKVEWPTLLFFTGLFVVVGALEHAGVLLLIANALTSITHNLWVLMMIVLWASAVLSAIVDNIPFVAVMIPIIQTLQAGELFGKDPHVHLLWWALALGACLGGNATAIGASANVVSCAVARSQGVEITFAGFARDAVPSTFIMIVVCAAYLSVLFWM